MLQGGGQLWVSAAPGSGPGQPQGSPSSALAVISSGEAGAAAEGQPTHHGLQPWLCSLWAGTVALLTMGFAHHELGVQQTGSCSAAMALLTMAVAVALLTIAAAVALLTVGCGRGFAHRGLWPWLCSRCSSFFISSALVPCLISFLWMECSLDAADRSAGTRSRGRPYFLLFPGGSCGESLGFRFFSPCV